MPEPSVAERKSILLRLDPSVHDALARWAADELRSTNAQIEFLLRRALTDAGRSPSPALSPSGAAQEKSLPRSAFVGQRRVGLGVAIT